ncbi:MAG: acyltransferase family protein [Pseudorhodoplanes sp.]
MTATTTSYRSDIDGLRALAVLPVVLYHMNIPGISGGFLGVDVFFVISGFLICGMVDKDIRKNRFSLVDFYKRRALRILPALVVVLIATSLLAFRYNLPVELKEYAASLASAVASISNGYFAATAGYFDAPAETKPLLHTWSLSVEEQFYLFVPLFMTALYRFMPRRVGLVLAAATILSFLACIAMTLRNPSFAFYLTPFRAWELALGALLAIGIIPTPRGKMLRETCGAVGLVLLVGVYHLAAPTHPLPLVSAIACIGAVLFIASNGHALSTAGRLLSWRPLVFIGLLSYSLYLWHWPLIVFQKSDALLSNSTSAVVVNGILLGTMFVLAYLSWRFVERPFRSHARDLSTRTVFVGSGGAIAGILAASLLVIIGGGAAFRFSPQIVAIGAYLGYDPAPTFRTGTCYLGANRQRFDSETCLKMDANKPNYLLLGDSHAAHLWSGLAKALPDVNLLQASASMCRPLIQPVSALDSRACPRLMNEVFGNFLTGHKIDRVLLSASWKDEDFTLLASTLDTLRARGLKVTVLGPIVEYDGALPRLLVNEILKNDTSIARSHRSAGIPERDHALRDIARAHGADYISVYDAVCPQDRCQVYAERDVPLQFDAGHLTNAGADIIGARIAAALRGERPLSHAASATSR